MQQMYIFLDIVKEFTCEMCGLCCRNDWQVTLDEDSYYKNKQLFIKSDRGEEFSKAFIPLTGERGLGEYAYIAKQDKGGCWFLAENNRCQLQCEAGHNHLDHVCQTFPRYPMDTARGTELTLSFSCPAVIKMASRSTPLAIVRSEVSPIFINPNNDVVHVYPQQQPDWEPLRYYFELEQHFIDIMQCRSITIRERLQMIKATIQALHCLKRNQDLGQQLNKIVYANYEVLDKHAAVEQHIGLDMPAILLENFFVNFIFKKPFYIYGLQPGMQLLENIWQRIEFAREAIIDPAMAMEATQSIIMEVEFQYSHNRRSLFPGSYQSQAKGQ